MTTEEINKGNSGIAEFLGGKVKSAFKIKGQEILAWCGPVAEKWRVEQFDICGSCILVEHLEFHKSWNWQIPAFSKIAHRYKELAAGSDSAHDQYLKFLQKYENSIFTNNQEKGWQILVQAIKEIVQHENHK